MNSIFFHGMSKRQYIWLITGFCLITILICLGFMQNTRKPQTALSAFSTEMTIKQIAPKLGVTGKSLARELNFPLNVGKNKPLKGMGVGEKKFRKVVTHLLGHRSSPIKYYLYAVLVLWGWLFLVYVGRPEGMPLDRRKKWYPRLGYLIPLFVSVIIAGFLLGKSPNPMEGAVKVFKSMVGLYPDIWEKVAAFAFFVMLAVFGNKLICGWACPLPAMEGRLKEKAFPADCFSCARCLNVCPVDAVTYQSVFKS